MARVTPPAVERAAGRRARLLRFGPSLRTKLLMATLVLMLIPFVGFGYVREMETFLRAGQEQAVIGAARAVATALHDRPRLMELRSDARRVPTPEEAAAALRTGRVDDGTAHIDGISETALDQLGRGQRRVTDAASAEIDAILQGMGRGQTRIWVVDRQRQLLAVTGSLQRTDADPPLVPPTSGHLGGRIEQAVLRPLYTWLLAPPSEDFEDALPETLLSGGRELEKAFSGIPGSRWRHTTDFRATVISAAHPVWSSDEVIGAVVVEETANAVLTLRNRAFEHLLTVTLAVFVLGAGALALFASRLSARIGRLRDDAENAIDSQGRVRALVRGSNAADEIGDLSRSVATMVERLAQYNTYLERMADRLSHELRTPVAVVSSSIENLKARSLPDGSAIYIERAEDGLKRLNVVLKRMREATQLEHMLREVERERFDLARVVEGCVAGYRGAFPQARFELIGLDAGAGHLPDGPLWLLGAPDLVAILLDKIVENAVDFSPAGEAIEVRVGQREATAVLAVSNVGPGLPETMRGQLFESMISLRDRATGGRSQPHLGLGLFMVRLIAGYHHARAEAFNRADGRGVTIEVAFPLAI